MRISSRFFLELGINSIVDQQSVVSDTQLRLASGKNILTPSDDPVASTEILGLNQDIARTEQLQKNVEFASSRIQLEETTLKAVETGIFRVRELTVQSMNTALPPASLQSIRQEIDLRLEEIIGLANTKDGTGEFIFAGFNGKTKPFVRDPTGVLIYIGDQGQRNVQIGSSLQIAISDSGFDVFQDITQGNGTFVASDNPANTGTGIIDPGTLADPASYVVDTYSITFATGAGGQLEYSVTGAVSGPVVGPIAYSSGSNISFNGVSTSISGTPAAGDTFTLTPSQGQSLFTTLENTITSLGASNETQRLNGLNRALTDLDQVIDNLSEIRAKIGARLNTADIEKEVNSSFILFQKTSRSRLEDLDFAVAASDLSRQSLALEAAQQSFVRIQNLSLFNFLR